ncbi:RNA polymerase sigma factor [Pontibacter cellulosilyticus]|uniref:Sigma-70 family RNA polymerase sigma factor n=1 Tax=Pontibacter cellulosilyticus TaxID=1720253 RepID=A0A923N874_9BACT|nr:sigma-70 family RNA polymerase sigma factor [Pontibacter cellulosilyticus]MBC5993993.1 sigma-70 family RNA polymerase sigma factor [Pontibacter cellulosilyticus]
MSERELIEKCIAKERRAQEMLYRQYADKMYNVCLIYTKDEDEACDVLQEGFIKVFRSLASYEFTGSFEGWVRKIMVNTALAYYQKKKREKEHLDIYQTYIDPLVDSILDRLHADELIALVNQLPSKAGMVLKLFAIEGYDHKEIAELMGTSEGTSRSQLNRARFLLKESIARQEGKVIALSKNVNETKTAEA